MFDDAPDPFENAFLHAFPNPERVGCPGTEVLRDLATRKLPITDPRLSHVTECSPCFQEFRAMRADLAKQERRPRLLTLRISYAVAASIIAGVLWFSLSASRDRNPEMAIASLDVSNSSRRGEAAQASSLHSISRNARIIRLFLPTGSRSGDYEVQLRNGSDEGDVLFVTRGTARKESGGKTTMIVDLRLSDFPVGSYGLAWRLRNTELWSYGTFQAK